MSKQSSISQHGYRDQLRGNLFRIIPPLDRKVKAKGWPYIFAWTHRITALLLVLYLVFHILTLSSLTSPVVFDQKMLMFRSPLFIFLEWALAIPVIFHALNGGRLLSYELLGIRNDHFLLRCVVYFSLIYIFTLAYFMILGNQNVPYLFFWLVTLIFSLGLTIPLFISLKNFFRSHGILWKLQRITASLLFVLIPAHMFFSHLTPSIGHEADVILSRMRTPFIKFIDSLLILTVSYHAAYGIYSIMHDYIGQRSYRILIVLALILIFVILAAIGLNLVYSI